MKAIRRNLLTFNQSDYIFYNRMTRRIVNLERSKVTFKVIRKIKAPRRRTILGGYA